MIAAPCVANQTLAYMTFTSCTYFFFLEYLSAWAQGLICHRGWAPLPWSRHGVPLEILAMR
jgi:hypothetical protein